MTEQIIIQKVEKPNWYEFGAPGDRHHLAYDKPEDLESLIILALKATAAARGTKKNEGETK